MATDVEKSITDERDKPAPAKRQRIAFNGSDEHPPHNSNDQRSREILKKWQACQAATCYVDDTINRVLEKYEKSPPLSYNFEDPWYHFFRGNRMEDTAVSMAIRNYGLVRCLDLTRSQSEQNEKLPNTFSTPESIEIPMKPFSDNSLPSTSQEIDWNHEKYDSDYQQDFLDRAVAEAIKKKGLSTLSVDYG